MLTSGDKSWLNHHPWIIVSLGDFLWIVPLQFIMKRTFYSFNIISVWTWGRTSSLWGWRSTGTGCPGSLWILLLWRYSRPAWTWSCAACCRWPFFGRKVGLDDPQRSLPTPTILWFCDTAAKAVLELHIHHQPLLAGENKVQHSISPRWILYHLEKEGIINTFQEPLGLLLPCCVVPSTEQLKSPMRTSACECKAASISLYFYRIFSVFSMCPVPIYSEILWYRTVLSFKYDSKIFMKFLRQIILLINISMC